jgi:hypothetical protein
MNSSAGSTTLKNARLEDRRLKVRTLNSLCVLALLNRVGAALWRRGRNKRQSYYHWREEHKARCDGMLKL